MISINRQPCPRVLRRTSTQDLYDHDDVVEVLWDMQCRKCCYCEQFVADVGQGQHVDHFRPKSVGGFAALRNKWSNLLLSCPMCNGQKGEQFPVNGRGGAILIDPSSKTLDPERHIGFIVDYGDDDPTGMPVHRTRRGRTTIETIGLYLPHHVRLRRGHFRTVVRPRYEELLKAHPHRSRNSNRWRKAKTEFEALMTGFSPYISFVRCFARRKGLANLGIRIPSGAC